MGGQEVVGEMSLAVEIRILTLERAFKRYKKSLKKQKQKKTKSLHHFQGDTWTPNTVSASLNTIERGP